jgi:hypothetical protein
VYPSVFNSDAAYIVLLILLLGGEQFSVFIAIILCVYRGVKCTTGRVEETCSNAFLNDTEQMKMQRLSHKERTWAQCLNCVINHKEDHKRRIREVELHFSENTSGGNPVGVPGYNIIALNGYLLIATRDTSCR